MTNITMSDAGPSNELRSQEVGFAHVLVPLDGTALSAAALPTAQAIADRFGAQVHAIGVARSAQDISALRNAAKVGLGAMVADDRFVVAIDDDPAQAIARHAHELGSCLVTMSTNGRGRLGGALLGSTARSAMSHVGPIIAVGPNAERPGWTPPPPRWPAPLTVRRIVACVDGSAESEAVLPVAAGWCRELGMTLSILMCVEAGPEPLQPGHLADGNRSTDDQYLDELADRWHEAVPGIDTVLVKEPISPANGLRLHLDRRPAGLVAVSTQARSRFRRILRGAMADTMIRASTAPCLVVPQ